MNELLATLRYEGAFVTSLGQSARSFAVGLTFNQTLEAKRYFFFLPDWLDKDGRAMCKMTENGRFVFAHNFGLTIVNDGLEFEEVVRRNLILGKWEVIAPESAEGRGEGLLSARLRGRKSLKERLEEAIDVERQANSIVERGSTAKKGSTLGQRSRNLA